MEKEPTMLDFLEDMLCMTSGMVELFKERPEHIGKDTVDGLVVSTVWTTDLLVYETAIKDKNGFKPVERYNSKGDAVLGHQKWMEKAKTIETITMLGFGKSIPDEEVQLIRD